jgi:AAA+ superfamily predicted ATPase
VAELYAQFLRELGFVNERYLSVTAKDLMGDVVGASRKKTAEVLSKAQGGVLFLDEAYAIDPKRPGNAFGQEVVDELVAFMDQNPDTVVIFGGYADEIEKLLSANPGLPSRFQRKIHFADYSDDELGRIFSLLANKEGLLPTDQAVLEAGRITGRVRGSRDFANARTVRNLLQEAKVRQSGRISALFDAAEKVSAEQLSQLTLDDLIGDEPPSAETAAAALEKLDALEGLDEVKRKVRELVDLAEYQKMQARSGEKVNPIRLHMAFRGNPGTGKTTVARIGAEALCAAGVLPTTKFKEVRGEDLIAGFQGQTKDRVKEIVEEALGGVLFIDEASGIFAGGNSFGHQAVKSLIAHMENNYDNLMVIFADYDDRIDMLLSMDAGMASRLGEQVHFADYSKIELRNILMKNAAALGFILGQEDADRAAEFLDAKRRLPGFGNAREADRLLGNAQKRLAKRVVERTRRGEQLTAEEKKTLRLEDLVTGEMTASLGDQRLISPLEEDPTARIDVETAKRIPTSKQTKQKAKSAARLNAWSAVQDAQAALGLSPADAFEAMLHGDAALIAEIAAKTGVSPEVVAKELKDAAEKAEQRAKAKEIDFICMHCGNSNPACPFKDAPDRERHNLLNR